MQGLGGDGEEEELRKCFEDKAMFHQACKDT